MGQQRIGHTAVESQNGLALATSIASMLNLGFLLAGLNHKLKGLPWGRLLPSLARTFGFSILMGAVVWWLAGPMIPDASASILSRTAGLLAVVAAGGAFYLGLAWVFNSRELSGVLAELKKRKSEA